MKLPVASTLATLMVVSMGVTLPAAAQTAVAAAAEPTTMAAPADMSEGEIRKISKDTGKLTIRHGEIKNLDMPPMTMVFVAKDPAMLDAVEVGDKVRFVVIEEGGKMVVTELQPAR
ncbi:copper-binding protein [Hydrogenophaga crassostreae]|uniref:Copper-binding protein n=1 Tax=Hydrogenophaga crassostreae TaxID=1763535 RepID=A0A163CA70_9BURK|nr:copper-binding protein [Hydrogenophaga crassostreae]AOW12603.1 copper-binding protein [Hydrogenophaga crassostreae]OAD40474.1 copper-binding protein [Hydrogenophaga crassostreae]